MEISLEKLYKDLWPQKAKSEGFVFNSFLGVLCPKKYFFIYTQHNASSSPVIRARF